MNQLCDVFFFFFIIIISPADVSVLRDDAEILEWFKFSGKPRLTSTVFSLPISADKDDSSYSVNKHR